MRALDGPGIVSGDLLVTSARGELPVRCSGIHRRRFDRRAPLYARTTEQLAAARGRDRSGRDRRVYGDRVGFADLREVTATDRGAVREARVELPLQSVAPVRIWLVRK